MGGWIRGEGKVGKIERRRKRRWKGEKRREKDSGRRKEVETKGQK